MYNSADNMMEQAQIKFRDVGLELIKNPKIQPEDIFNVLDDLNEEQYFAIGLNSIDEIIDRLQQINRQDLINIVDKHVWGDHKAVNSPKGREFIEFYLNNLI